MRHGIRRDWAYNVVLHRNVTVGTYSSVISDSRVWALLIMCAWEIAIVTCLLHTLLHSVQWSWSAEGTNRPMVGSYRLLQVASFSPRFTFPYAEVNTELVPKHFPSLLSDWNKKIGEDDEYHRIGFHLSSPFFMLFMLGALHLRAELAT